MAAVVDEGLVENLGASEGGGAEEEPVVVGAEQMVGREGECLLEDFLAYGEAASEETEADEVAGQATEDVALDAIVGGAGGRE